MPRLTALLQSSEKSKSQWQPSPPQISRVGPYNWQIQSSEGKGEAGSKSGGGVGLKGGKLDKEHSANSCLQTSFDGPRAGAWQTLIGALLWEGQVR